MPANQGAEFSAVMYVGNSPSR